MREVRFHARALSELGIQADFSAEGEVHAQERYWGFRFPPSVVEWYSLKGAVELLETYRKANADRLGVIIPVCALGDPGQGDPDVPFRGYLQLYRAGEADLSIYTILDGSDDPAVFVDDCVYDGDLLVPRLIRYKESFSDFIYDWIKRGRAEFVNS